MVSTFYKHVHSADIIDPRSERCPQRSNCVASQAGWMPKRTNPHFDDIHECEINVRQYVVLVNRQHIPAGIIHEG
jgi:uncharacterized protein (DUF1499 family)